MKQKNIIKLSVILAFLLVAPFFAIQQNAFAGQSGCQTGGATQAECRVNNCDQNCRYNPNLPACATRGNREQQLFAAAQIKYEQSQPPGDGASGNDSSMRSRISYFASILILFGGLWLLISLLRQHSTGNRAPKFAARRGGIWNFALKPSFALSAFGVLFAAAIIGGALTAPAPISAQAENEPADSSSGKVSAPNSPAATNQPVFKSAQQIGGTGGTTQIGAPIYDGYGNYYVRGAFSGTLTLGDTTLTATQGLDLFVAKFDAEENLLWARQGSGISNAPNDDLAVEGATAMGFNGYDLYVAGSFVKKLTLQGGTNPSVTLNDNGAPGYNYETFVAKYDQNGNLIWARGGNSNSPKNPDNLETGQNTINKILFDRSGLPYLAGIISGSNFLGVPISNFTCSNDQPCRINGKSDILLAYVEPTAGVPTGIKVIGGAGDDNALDLAVDNITNDAIPQFYLVGNTDSPSISFLATTGGGTYTNANNSISTFILKYEGNDVFGGWRDGVWVKFINNNNLVGINQIVTDPTTGGAFVTGYYKGTLTAQNSPPITNNRTGTGEAALAGFVAGVSRDDGSFAGLVGLGGAGKSLVIRPGQNIFVVGSLYDTGTFTAGGGPFGTTQTKTLDAYGGNDLFVAEISRTNFQFSSLKAIAGTGYQGLVAVGNPSAADGVTKNNYSPLGITLDETGRVVISGDFSGTLSLDCLTLQTPAASRHAYIARFLNYTETTSCRVWTNENPNNRNWNVSDNWNGGSVPAEGDSVYVPYRKVAQFDPIYNPASSTALTDLSIADNQTFILQQNLNLGGRLDLLGGIVNAGGSTLALGPSSEAFTTNGGRVIGKLQKQFIGSGSFTFPVGTANGYSPVTISGYNVGEAVRSFAVSANQGAYPNTATDLPTNRANRWWNLTNGGLSGIDLTFKYLPGDINAGTENQYRAYRIPTGGGAATQVVSTINTTAKTVTVPNVSQFSDWTLAQPLAPTAASVFVGGKVTAPDGRGAAQALVTITDANGATRTTLSNSFGYYRFADVLVGQTYVVGIRHKRYGFAPQIVALIGEMNELDFSAQ